MTMFDGLYLYEIVMLALGVALFIALAVMLVFLIVKRRAYAKLFMFFSIPIIMIGFPSIKSIEYSDGVVKIETDTATLERDPANTTVRAQLASTVSSLAPRPSSNPETIARIARAQIALGNNDQAQAEITQGLQLAPKDPQVLAAQKRLELDQKLTTLAARVEKQPNDSQVRQELQAALSGAAKGPIASPVTIANLARAQAALGDTEQAKQNVEKALAIKPNLTAAIQLKNKLFSPVR